MGPLLVEDVNAFEKIHRFDHERIPERVIHARGAAAHDTTAPSTTEPRSTRSLLC